MIEYNPLAKNHNKLKKIIKESKEEQKRQFDELDWYNTTSKKKLQEYVSSLESKNKKYQSKARNSVTKINEFNVDIEGIGKQIESIVKLEIKDKQQKRVEIKKGIQEIERKIKDSEIHVKEIINSIIKKKFIQVEKIDNDLGYEYKQTKALEENIKSRFNPLNWVSKEQNNYVKKLKTLKNSMSCRAESKLSVQTSISYLQKNTENLEMSVGNYFDSKQKVVLQYLGELKNNLNTSSKLKKSLLKDIHYLEINFSNAQLSINFCKNKQELKKCQINISELEGVIACERRKKEEIEKNIEQNKEKIRETIFDIDKLEKFDVKKVKDIIDRLNRQISKEQQQVQLKEHVDRKLVSIISEINRLGDEKVDITNKIVNTNNDIKNVEDSIRLTDNFIKEYKDVITKAERFKDRLNNSVDRRVIHEQCELELGDGRPGRVIYEKRGLINEQKDLRNEKKRLIIDKTALLSRYKKQVTGINRNIEKKKTL